MKTYDCVVVGAGCYGLAAARQYRFTQPGHSVRIFDAEATIGGTWSEARLYPDLKTNNLLGTYEYPDFPMDPERFGVEKGRHIPGPEVHAYLKAYAAEFGLSDLIHFRTKVTVAEHLEGEENPQGGWILTVVDFGKQEPAEFKVRARRLIIASGLTSEPFIPRLPGEEHFGGRIFHTKFFGQNDATLKTARSVTILGGHKSAWDAVYSYATAGVEINWVIRPNGQGPCWIAPPYVTPFKRWIEHLAHTRLLTWFSPCIWSESGGFVGVRKFLHGTTIGRLIVSMFWGVMGRDVSALCGFDSHPKTAKLKPWLPVMFSSPQFSILNYDLDFFELVRSDKINVHIAEIDRLSPGRVHLSNGDSFESEAIMYNTGWKHVVPMKFLPEGIERELGVPHQQMVDTVPEDLGNRQDLIERADREILRRFPRLIDQPDCLRRSVDPSAEKRPAEPEPLTMSMMYRFTIPASERFLRHRDIAFCGMLSNFGAFASAHIQGLWIGSFFAGLLAKDPSKAVGNSAALNSLQYETVTHNRFCRWRYPADHTFPAFIFDALSYWDMLMRDMGLIARRKQSGGIFSEITSPYGTWDYSSVNDEWGARYQKSKVDG